MSKKRKSPLTEKQVKALNVLHFKREIDQIKQKAHEEYHPKWGRKIKQLERKLKNIA